MIDLTEDEDRALNLARWLELPGEDLNRLRSEVRALRIVGLDDDAVHEHVWSRVSGILQEERAAHGGTEERRAGGIPSLVDDPGPGGPGRPGMGLEEAQAAHGRDPGPEATAA